MLSPTAACLPCATVRGPVGFALTNSTRMRFGSDGTETPNRSGSLRSRARAAWNAPGARKKLMNPPPRSGSSR